MKCQYKDTKLWGAKSKKIILFTNVEIQYIASLRL